MCSEYSFIPADRMLPLRMLETGELFESETGIYGFLKDKAGSHTNVPGYFSVHSRAKIASCNPGFFRVANPRWRSAQSDAMQHVPAIFLDRDGTLIEEREYLADPDGVVLYPGAGPALRRLQEAGFKLVVVTNQSGIGRGYYTEADMHRVNERMQQLLASDGVQIEKIYFAPERPDQPSRGRKPSPQFVLEARDEFGLDLARSYIIGDKLIDLECGWNAGVKQAILVRTGYGSKVEQNSPEQLIKAWVVDDLPAAASRILL